MIAEERKNLSVVQMVSLKGFILLPWYTDYKYYTFISNLNCHQRDLHCLFKRLLLSVIKQSLLSKRGYQGPHTSVCVLLKCFLCGWSTYVTLSRTEPLDMMVGVSVPCRGPSGLCHEIITTLFLYQILLAALTNSKADLVEKWQL